MSEYREVYIQITDFAVLQGMGRLYEGFVIGLGYAFRYSSSVNPPSFNGYSHVDDVPPQLNRFRLIKHQYVDNSPEMIELSIIGITSEGAKIYTVRQGDTLITIAQEYRASVENLIKWNKISSSDQLQVGQKLIVSESSRDLLSDKQSQMNSSSHSDKIYSSLISVTNNLEFEDYIGPVMILSGQRFIPKHGGVGGGGNAGKWTSAASKGFRAADRVIQQRLGTNVKFPAKGLVAKSLGTRGIGAVIGRCVPYIGWGVTAWDIGWSLGENYGISKWPGFYREYKERKDREKRLEDLLRYLDKDANR